jgi:transcriptional regulator with XRE-family HTH domain
VNLLELGAKIRSLRKEKSLTQEQLAKKAQISRATLSKLENGYYGHISIATIDNILSTLGYEIDIKPKNPFFSQK